MDFIIVLAKVYPKEGCKDSVIEISSDLIENTLEEDGNIDYQLLQSINDNTLTFVEKWESLDALKNIWHLHISKNLAAKLKISLKRWIFKL